MSTKSPRSLSVTNETNPRQFQYNNQWLSQKKLHDYYDLTKEDILKLPTRFVSSLGTKINRATKRKLKIGRNK